MGNKKFIATIAASTMFVSGAGAILVEEAEAKRFGGGSSFGSRSSFRSSTTKIGSGSSFSSVKSPSSAVNKWSSNTSNDAWRSTSKSWNDSKTWKSDYNSWKSRSHSDNYSFNPVNYMIWSSVLNNNNNIDSVNIDKMDDLFEIVDTYYAENTVDIKDVEKIIIADDLKPIDDNLISAEYEKLENISKDFDVEFSVFSSAIISYDDFLTERAKTVNSMKVNQEEAIKLFDEEYKEEKSGMTLVEENIASTLREMLDGDKMFTILTMAQYNQVQENVDTLLNLAYNKAMDKDDASMMQQVMDYDYKITPKKIDELVSATMDENVSLDVFQTVVMNMNDKDLVEYTVNKLGEEKDDYLIFAPDEKVVDGMSRILSDAAVISSSDLKIENLPNIYKMAQVQIALGHIQNNRS